METRLYTYTPTPRQQQTFTEYIETERQRRAAVDPGSAEWGALSLRVSPPNVEVDNESFPNRTVVTIDSANRPGTLIEVVQCLTELGLNIDKARVSSDGGWFVDEFHITEQDGSKVVNQKKLSTIRKVLSIDFETEFSDESKQVATVFELSGMDRCGLLADVIQLITKNFEVRSAAVWTYNNRVAFVVGVVEDNQPIKDSKKLNDLKLMLQEIMDGEKKGDSIVSISSVGALIHHERRLHNLMLLEEQRAWKQNEATMLANSTSTSETSSPSSVLDLDEEHITSASLRAQFRDLNLADQGDTKSSGAAVALLNGGLAGPLAQLMGGTAAERTATERSRKHSTPQISITECKYRNYWLVNIRCRDRVKLFFDTVCTLADTNFNIYHATIDTDIIDKEVYANQLYYIRPRFGDYVWDESKVTMLKYLLDASIQRRFPKGLKVHVHTFDRHSLYHLTAAFKVAGLAITRGKVRPHLSDEGGHTFYLMESATNTVPDPAKVSQLLQANGGRFVDNAEELRAGRMGDRSGGGHPFCYALRGFTGIWTGVNSPTSSVTSA